MARLKTYLLPSTIFVSFFLLALQGCGTKSEGDREEPTVLTLVPSEGQLLRDTDTVVKEIRWSSHSTFTLGQPIMCSDVSPGEGWELDRSNSSHSIRKEECSKRQVVTKACRQQWVHHSFTCTFNRN